MTNIILKRTPRGRCRICKHVWYDSDADTAIRDHNNTCAQAFVEARGPDKLAFLKPQDPELQDWVTREYKAGRLKPSTERVI